ncbi:hypothetical protein SCALM49S_04552 [Streptomyces californicus]
MGRLDRPQRPRHRPRALHHPDQADRTPAEAEERSGAGRRKRRGACRGGGGGRREDPSGEDGKEETTPTKGSPALRILCLVLAIGFIYGLPWTTRIAIAAAAAWTTTAITLGLIATRPKAKPSEKDESSEQKKPDEPPQHPSELLPREHVAVLLSTLYTEGSGGHLSRPSPSTSPRPP